MKKNTRQDVDELKKDWMNDPIYEIEDVEGFEEYKDELLKFSVEQKDIWDAENEERRKRRDEIWIKSLTPEGILEKVRSSDQMLYRIDVDGSNAVQLEMVMMSHLQIKTNLIIAHQLERIADQLEEGSEGDFLNALWKVGIE